MTASHTAQVILCTAAVLETLLHAVVALFFWLLNSKGHANEGIRAATRKSILRGATTVLLTFVSACMVNKYRLISIGGTMVLVAWRGMNAQRLWKRRQELALSSQKITCSGRMCDAMRKLNARPYFLTGAWIAVYLLALALLLISA